MDLETAPPLYRMHIKTSSKDRAGTFQFCLDEGVIGVGWGVTWGDEAHPQDWEAYEAGARVTYGGVNPAVRTMRDMPDGALVWQRDPAGTFYLAGVDGSWSYASGQEPEEFDIRNVRPAHIVRCGAEAVVPRAVVDAFNRGHTIQRVANPAARRYSASLFEQLA